MVIIHMSNLNKFGIEILGSLLTRLSFSFNACADNTWKS